MTDRVKVATTRRAPSLAAWRTLTWRDRALVGEAVMVLTAIGVALKGLTFQRVHRLLGATGPLRRPRPADAASEAARVTRLGRIVAIAARRAPVRNTCLHRSLTLWWLLRRRGVDAALRVGARKRNGRFEAHAWVEHAGRPVGDSDREAPREYVPVAWMPASGRR